MLCHREVSDAEFKQHVHGKTSAMILQHFLGTDALSKEEIVRLSEEKEAEYRRLCLKNTDRFCLAPGLEDFLEDAGKCGVFMTIASAANYANMEFYFDYFNLERWFDFDKVVYDDATLKGKPDPDIYLRAMERMGAEPADCIVFEDAVSGITSARAAGAGVIVGVYGDSSRKLLERQPGVAVCIEDFRQRDKLQYVEGGAI